MGFGKKNRKRAVITKTSVKKQELKRYATQWEGIDIECPEEMVYYPNLVKQALLKIASKPVGRTLLRNIVTAPYPFRLESGGAVDESEHIDRKVTITKLRPDESRLVKGKFLVKSKIEEEVRASDRSVRDHETHATCGIAVASVVHWNPNNIFVPTGPRPAFIGLAHELIHAWHNLEGKALANSTTEEKATVGLPPYADSPITENNIRAEHEVPLRQRY